jgi:hypothetical protein
MKTNIAPLFHQELNFSDTSHTSKERRRKEN